MSMKQLPQERSYAVIRTSGRILLITGMACALSIAVYSVGSAYMSTRIVETSLMAASIFALSSVFVVVTAAACLLFVSMQKPDKPAFLDADNNELNERFSTNHRARYRRR
jgi:hypothetical protein